MSLEVKFIENYVIIWFGYRVNKEATIWIDGTIIKGFIYAKYSEQFIKNSMNEAKWLIIFGFMSVWIWIKINMNSDYILGEGSLA